MKKTALFAIILASFACSKAAEGPAADVVDVSADVDAVEIADDVTLAQDVSVAVAVDATSTEQ